MLIGTVQGIIIQERFPSFQAAQKHGSYSKINLNVDNFAWQPSEKENYYSKIIPTTQLSSKVRQTCGWEL